jgi:hypothetical protein
MILVIGAGIMGLALIGGSDVMNILLSPLVTRLAQGALDLFGSRLWFSSRKKQGRRGKIRAFPLMLRGLLQVALDPEAGPCYHADISVCCNNTTSC